MRSRLRVRRGRSRAVPLRHAGRRSRWGASGQDARGARPLSDAAFEAGADASEGPDGGADFGIPDAGLDGAVELDGTPADAAIRDALAADRQAPDGPLPDGPLPDGQLPDGPLPDGPLPDGPLPDGPPPPARFTVTLQGVVVAPGKSDRRPWDGLGILGDEVYDALAEALDENDAYAALEELLGSDLIRDFERPDPVGEASLAVDGGADVVRGLVERGNTYAPRWDVSWLDIPFEDDTRLSWWVTLEDADLALNDFIGEVEVTEVELRPALESGEPTPILVRDQSDDQLLFVIVQIIP